MAGLAYTQARASVSKFLACLGTMHCYSDCPITSRLRKDFFEGAAGKATCLHGRSL